MFRLSVIVHLLIFILFWSLLLQKIRRRKLSLMVELNSFICSSIYQQHPMCQACNSFVINNSLMPSSLIHNHFWGLILIAFYDLIWITACDQLSHFCKRPVAITIWQNANSLKHKQWRVELYLCPKKHWILECIYHITYRGRFCKVQWNKKETMKKPMTIINMTLAATTTLLLFGLLCLC